MNWKEFLKIEKDLAKGTDEKYWKALKGSTTTKDQEEIRAAGEALGMTVKTFKNGSVDVFWN